MMMLAVLFACNARCRASEREELDAQIAIEALNKAIASCMKGCDELLGKACEDDLNLAVSKQGALPEERIEVLQGLVKAKVECERNSFVEHLSEQIGTVLRSCEVPRSQILDFSKQPDQLVKRLECKVRDELTDKFCEEPCMQSIVEMDVQSKGEVICVSDECIWHSTVATFLFMVRNFCSRLRASESGYQKGEAHWQNLCEVQKEQEQEQEQAEMRILKMVVELFDNVLVQHCRLPREMLTQLSDGKMPAELQTEVCRENHCETGISMLKEFWEKSPDDIQKALNSPKFSNINKGAHHLFNLESCAHQKKQRTNYYNPFKGFRW